MDFSIHCILSRGMTVSDGYFKRTTLVAREKIVGEDGGSKGTRKQTAEIFHQYIELGYINGW